MFLFLRQVAEDVEDTDRATGVLGHLEHIEEIGGVGGRVTVIGTVETTIKLGKQQARQTFLVVKESVAGYDCLLGQDFLRRNCGGIFFTEHSVNFALGVQLERWAR